MLIAFDGDPMPPREPPAKDPIAAVGTGEVNRIPFRSVCALLDRDAEAKGVDLPRLQA